MCEGLGVHVCQPNVDYSRETSKSQKLAIMVIISEASLPRTRKIRAQ